MNLKNNIENKINWSKIKENKQNKQKNLEFKFRNIKFIIFIFLYKKKRYSGLLQVSIVVSVIDRQ